ncbi:hypothetical protein [Streptomyces sp. CBMA152]|uniref:hypothetical protein n=1 Tax=Streptomyces sp. CBMA152 TaxID=1896312 RepID=UPI001CB71EDB|nr:hypothetical protein [Streptomyces sp. CBMA152]MBD0741490.1 hypothetical protein [Streptomyces sp. CBMA152]
MAVASLFRFERDDGVYRQSIDYEGDPEAKPFAREALQLFLAYADEQVERAVRAKRKGALAAYRDATLLKIIYGWVLHRTETSQLDLVDFGRNPQARQFGSSRSRSNPDFANDTEWYRSYGLTLTMSGPRREGIRGHLHASVADHHPRESAATPAKPIIPLRAGPLAVTCEFAGGVSSRRENNGVGPDLARRPGQLPVSKRPPMQ